MNKVLVVAAHPDDETLMAGGLLHRLSRQGVQTKVLVLCENGSLRYGDCSVNQGSLGEAMKTLGVGDWACRGYPDQRLDTENFVEVVQSIAMEVREYQPDTVVTHWSGDLNRDHRIVQEAVLVATRPKVGCPVKTVLEGFVPSTSEWQWGVKFQPQMYVSLDDADLKAKLEAFQCYTAEQAEDTPRSMQGLLDYARVWGREVGIQAAEVFRVLRTTL